MAISKTQIDRLGDRLKQGPHTESDLRLLDEYRRLFGEACEAVVRTIRELGEAPTARLAKSTLSIVEKLRRESIRLSQMQDIAGCRVVVADIVKQDQFIESLKTAFPDASIVDRRENPTYGYRAVHVIAEVAGKTVEIQVRSTLQHLWAELSEKCSDVVGPMLKYGGGSEELRASLLGCSKSLASYEGFEETQLNAVASMDIAVADYEEIEKAAIERLSGHLPDQTRQDIQEKWENSKLVAEQARLAAKKLRGKMEYARNSVAEFWRCTIAQVENLKRQEQ